MKKMKWNDNDNDNNEYQNKYLQFIINGGHNCTRSRAYTIYI